MGLDARDQFVDQLNKLRERAGHPSLAALQAEAPAQLARENVSRLLKGEFKRPPPWERVRAFVVACVQIGKSKNLTMPPQNMLLEELRHDYTALARILEQTSRRGSQPASDKRPVTPEPQRRRRFGAVPPRAGAFQHRVVAETLAKAVESGGTVVLTGAAITPANVLTGLDGVGKTQLAADHAHTVWDCQQVELLVWISARTRDAVAAAYTEVAVEWLDQDPADPERAWRRFREWLAETSARWLIVLDDLQNPADLTGLWPPHTGGGQVMVTTRCRDATLHGTGRRIVDVDLFTAPEALAYLLGKLPARSTESSELGTLAEELGFLPLALAQASAYLANKPLLAIADYRTRLADRKTTLGQVLPRVGELPDEHEQIVAATWSLSIDAADEFDPVGLARPLLEMAALLDPAGVPVAVFTADVAAADLKTRLDRDITVGDILGGLECLQRFSLLTLDPEQPHRGVRVHALVQRAVRGTLTPNAHGSLARTVASALHKTWPDVEVDQELAQALRSNTGTLQEAAEEHLWQPDGHPVLLRLVKSLEEAQLFDAAIMVTKRLHHQASTRLCDADNSQAHYAVSAKNRLRTAWRFKPGGAVLRRRVVKRRWPRWRSIASVAIVIAAVVVAPWQPAGQSTAPAATSMVASRIVHADTRGIADIFARDVTGRPIRGHFVAGRESSNKWSNLGDIVLTSDPVGFRKENDNAIGLFGREASGRLMYSYIDGRSGKSSTWAGIGSSSIVGMPSVIYRSPGNVIDVFARDEAGRLVHAHASDTLSNWTNLAIINDAPIVTDPVAIYNSVDDVIEIFARNKENSLVHIRSNGIDNWSGWNAIGGDPIVGTPSVVYKKKNNVTEVFARNVKSMPVHCYVSDDSNGWTRWYGITVWDGSDDIPLSSDLTSVYKVPSNSTEIFALDTKGHVVHSYLTEITNRFSFWAGIGGGTFVDLPTATYVETENLTEMFGRDSTGTPVRSYAIGTSENWINWLAVGSVKIASVNQK